MRFYYSLIATFLPVLALAGKSHDTLLRSRHASRAAALRVRANDTYPANATASSPYQRQQHYEGESFFK
jgi:hypothetical protein